MRRREPSYQDLLAQPHGPLLLQQLSARLRVLGNQGETAQARSEIEAALASPWWGLRQLAIRAIGAWKGRANRAWLTERARRRSLHHRVLWDLPRGADERWRHVETVTCRESVVPSLDAADADWVLDLWFEGYTTFDGLHGALGRLPAESLEARLETELACGDGRRIEAAIWLVFNAKHLVERESLYDRLRIWPDPALAELASRVMVIEERTKRVAAMRAAGRLTPRTASARRGGPRRS